MMKDGLLDSDYSKLKKIVIDAEHPLLVKVRKEDWVKVLYSEERKVNLKFLLVSFFLWVTSYLEFFFFHLSIAWFIFTFIILPFLLYFSYKKSKTLQRLYLFDLEFTDTCIYRYEYSKVRTFNYDEIQVKKEVGFGMVISKNNTSVRPYLLRTFLGHFFHEDYLVVPKSILYYDQIKDFLEQKID